MNKYDVLKDFKGSPDGRFAVDYKAGETVELTDSLAEVALKEKWVRLSKSAKEEAKAKAKAEADEEERVRLAAERAAAEQAINDAIADLEAQIEAAAEADKPALQKALEGKRAELAAL